MPPYLRTHPLPWALSALSGLLVLFVVSFLWPAPLPSHADSWSIDSASVYVFDHETTNVDMVGLEIIWTKPASTAAKLQITGVGQTYEEDLPTADSSGTSYIFVATGTGSEHSCTGYTPIVALQNGSSVTQDTETVTNLSNEAHPTNDQCTTPNGWTMSGVLVSSSHSDPYTDTIVMDLAWTKPSGSAANLYVVGMGTGRLVNLSSGSSSGVTRVTIQNPSAYDYRCDLYSLKYKIAVGSTSITKASETKDVAHSGTSNCDWALSLTGATLVLHTATGGIQDLIYVDFVGVKPSLSKAWVGMLVDGYTQTGAIFHFTGTGTSISGRLVARTATGGTTPLHYSGAYSIEVLLGTGSVIYRSFLTEAFHPQAE